MTKRQFIENFFIQTIKSGEFLPGQRLDSEDKIAQRFGVSVVTVKSVLLALVHSGHLRRVQGAGTFVAPSNSGKIPIALSVKGFHDIALGQRVTPCSQIITLKKIIPPLDVREKLKLEEKEKVVFYERINIFDDVPVSFEEGYLKEGFVPNIKKKDLETSRYQYYENNGCPIVRVLKTIIPIVPDKRIARFLNIQGRPPLQMVENISFNDKNQITDFTVAYYNPDKYIIQKEVEIGIDN